MTTLRNQTESEDYDPVLLGLTPEDMGNVDTLLAQLTLLMAGYEPIVRKAALHTAAQWYGYNLRRRVNGWDNNYRRR